MKEKSKTNPFASFNADNADRFALNLDWLQIHCVEKTRLAPSETNYLKIERTGQSKVFRSIYTITSKTHKRVLATYATEALEQIMPEGHGVLKIDNFYLYHYAAKIRQFIEWFLRRLDMNFMGITRIDIAYDFNLFCNKRDPENFIKSFLKDEIVKLKDTKFRVAGKHAKTNSYNWIAFGSKTSKVNYKLYNKTQEMKDVIHKAHIFQDWLRSKLDTEKDVWRLEFTINSNTNLLYNANGSFNFHALETIELQSISGLFKMLYESYFNFRFQELNQSRKDRMKKVDLLLFPEIFERLNMKQINPFMKDNTRATRIFVKKMNEVQDELRGKDDDFVYDARQLISKLISVYNLQEWAGKKGITFDILNYVEDLGIVESPQKVI